VVGGGRGWLQVARREAYPDRLLFVFILFAFPKRKRVKNQISDPAFRAEYFGYFSPR